MHAVLPATEWRAMRPAAINERNRQLIDQQVAAYAQASASEIETRIRELEAEWDIERALETSAALNMAFGVVMGALHSRRWYAFAGVVAAFLLQHALQGWCPPLPVLRRCGLRTPAEIFEEITALRVLRGDFCPTDNPAEAVTQVRHSAHRPQI